MYSQAIETMPHRNTVLATHLPVTSVQRDTPNGVKGVGRSGGHHGPELLRLDSRDGVGSCGQTQRCVRVVA